VLHALFNRDSRPLARWLSISPRNAVTVLDTHDGIGVIDVGADASGSPGLLSPEEIDNLVEAIHQRSRGQSRQATGAAARNLDLYQVNCTFLDALGGRETDYLIARALQFFAPGIPQVYYVGLLGGTNDMGLLARTGVGRDINRHYYTDAEIETALRRSLVRKQIELIRLRNTHPAFAGEFQVDVPTENQIQIQWRQKENWVKLHADLSVPSASITGTSPTGGMQHITIPDAADQGAQF
jgi:sucrose phosphorylase